MSSDAKSLKIRRALLTVSDKAGVVELARALAESGAELVATGRTAQVLREAGLQVTPIEQISGSPEAFQGRMKTLSFPVCSGILYRRGDLRDEADLRNLSVQPIDCVVVNFYPFEQAAARDGISASELIEEIDIGGPTLVRAAAKNAPSTLVLTDPALYNQTIAYLSREGTVPAQWAIACAARAWSRVLEYDRAIAERLGEGPREIGAPESSERQYLSLRYGENPHQKGHLEFASDSPIAWPAQASERLTPTELSYNNILDLSAAYALACDLRRLSPDRSGVVIVKHNNPCGVAIAHTQLEALMRAWEGDPVSAFGGVLVFTEPLASETLLWLSSRFVECIAAPSLAKEDLAAILTKRKNLKAVAIRRWDGVPRTSQVSVPGGTLVQETDFGTGTVEDEKLQSPTRARFPDEKLKLAQFGIAVCRSLKSNAIALVRETMGTYQLVGAGQGQPNRIEALRDLAVPRAHSVLSVTGGRIEECVMVSDAFFPFRDTVETAAQAGIKFIIQPGGSIKDAESVAACDEAGVAMAFTGVRHFRH